MVDTNTDPTLIDYPIPANDDAAKSISLIGRSIADAVIEVRQKVDQMKAETAAKESDEKVVEEKTRKDK